MPLLPSFNQQPIQAPIQPMLAPIQPIQAPIQPIQAPIQPMHRELAPSVLNDLDIAEFMILLDSARGIGLISTPEYEKLIVLADEVLSSTNARVFKKVREMVELAYKERSDRQWASVGRKLLESSWKNYQQQR
jgi:hypothetical protein